MGSQPVRGGKVRPFQRRIVETSAQPRSFDAGLFGMMLFLASLTMMFGAGLVAYLAIRWQAPQWPPPATPPLPRGMWLSTVVIVACSAALHWALMRVRARDPKGLVRGLTLGLVLAGAFLLFQTVNWVSLITRGVTARADLFGFTLFVLTGLHAAHVIGGLVPLVLVNYRARRGFYTPSKSSGLVYCGLYWHFLGAVWLVMFSVLYIAG
ncbi:MAG: cytochrome c oxidase subunit 3 [Acidobacteriota bacterium]|nr:MAG: cytochrome c oxidase subunit 3 [Acidobacteriota bacterium]